MASTIYRVNDKKLGTFTLVKSPSKRKAEKFMEQGRFEAVKASADDITDYNAKGETIYVVPDGTEPAPTIPETAPEAGAAAPGGEEAGEGEQHL